jgi:hypothetical protein
MVVTNRCYVFEMALQRFYRTIVMRGAALAGGSALTVICSCDGGGDELPDAGCPSSVVLHSSCGFENVTTTCGDGSMSCNGTTCTIGTPNDPITKNCTVDAKLADGTETTIDVSVLGKCLYANQGFLQCKVADAGTDGADDASDASEDAATDGAVDAPVDQ